MPRQSISLKKNKGQSDPVPQDGTKECGHHQWCENPNRFHQGSVLHYISALRSEIYAINHLSINARGIVWRDQTDRAGFVRHQFFRILRIRDQRIITIKRACLHATMSATCHD